MNKSKAKRAEMLSAGAHQYEAQHNASHNENQNNETMTGAEPRILLSWYPEFPISQINKKIQAEKTGGRKAEVLNKQTCNMQTEIYKSQKGWNAERGAHTNARRNTMQTTTKFKTTKPWQGQGPVSFIHDTPNSRFHK